MSDKVDYLDEDPVIPSQKYCVISVLTPKNFKNAMKKTEDSDEVVPANEKKLEAEPKSMEEYNNLIAEYNKMAIELASAKTQLLKYKREAEDEARKVTMYTFKVRGSYETVEEAQTRIQFLNSLDSNVNIYLAEVGKWCPFDDDPEKAKDAVYKDEELNRLMKGYKENQEKGKQLFEQRKAELVAKALQDTKDKKEKLKKQDDEERKKLLEGLQEKIDSESGTPKTKIEDTLQEKEKLLREKEDKVKDGKKEVEQKKSQIQSKEEKIRKLNDDLASAKKKYEEHLLKVSAKPQ